MRNILYLHDLGCFFILYLNNALEYKLGKPSIQIKGLPMQKNNKHD